MDGPSILKAVAISNSPKNRVDARVFNRAVTVLAFGEFNFDERLVFRTIGFPNDWFSERLVFRTISFPNECLN
jgi:hypothetical protein